MTIQFELFCEYRISKTILNALKWLLNEEFQVGKGTSNEY